jgi:hypothetical protein
MKIFFMIYKIHDFQNSLGFMDESLHEVESVFCDNAEQFHQYFQELYPTGHTFQSLCKPVTLGVPEVDLGIYFALKNLEQQIKKTMAVTNSDVNSAVRFLLQPYSETAKDFNSLSDKELDSFCYDQGLPTYQGLSSCKQTLNSLIKKLGD